MTDNEEFANGQPPVRNKSRAGLTGMILSVGLLSLFFLMAFSITKGAVKIPLSAVWDAFFNFNGNDIQHLIVIDIRLPRAIASALVGAAFAVAGAIMQGTTRNPLADSGLMGLNAGAGFALAMCYAFLPGLSYMRIIIASFLGAALGAALVNGIASFRLGGSTPTRLVLAGAAVSMFLIALSQGIAIYFEVAQDVMFWTVGGVSGSTWEQVGLIAPVILIALALSVALSRSVSVLSLGEDVAKGLGANTALIGVFCSVIVLILAGTSVAVVGAVGFVGLVVPHFVRYLVGVDYRFIIPCSAVLGALLVVAADLFARNLNPPFETPLGATIALIGVPFFLHLARRQKRAV
ncbi:MAG: iron ABC transporter permease [Candidatus Methanoplasma sp.]|nr:iron ABC transporter permease [Candidatus Methanoplasma sp.]